MTKKREAVYNVIKQSTVPLSAADISKRVPIPLDLATVYRTLHYLEKEEMVISFFFTCRNRGGEHYYYKERQPHIHFFHCHSCHTFIPLGDCNVALMERKLEDSHAISIDKHMLYFTGLCRECNRY